MASHQFAYLKNRSCEDALLYVLNRIYEGCERDGIVRCTFLDYSSAFNLVNHTVLYNKLSNLRIPPYLLNTIADFLKDRPQIVKIGKNTSDTIVINTGTPQGSVLSPILYILYTNDLKAEMPNCKIIKFADDTCLMGNVCNEQDFINYEVEINHISKWSAENYLVLNATKTHELVFNFKRKNLTFDENRHITLNGVEVIPEKNVKYLGLNISNNLKWSLHVDAMVKRTSSAMYNLRRLAGFITDRQIFTNVYCSLLRPILEYASTVWTWGVNTEEKTLLERQQKIACRIMQIDREQLPSLEKRRVTTCLEKYKRLENCNSHILNEFICDKLEMTGYYRLKNVKTERCKRSFFYYTPIAANNVN